MAKDGVDDAAEILAFLNAAHDLEAPRTDLGRRERKKRELRQTISNVATALVLAHGFEKVTVSQIAEACDVSEQTVFNYFPTKESMFFDRTDDAVDALAATIREADGDSLSRAIAELLSAASPPTQWNRLDEPRALEIFRRFSAAIDESPTLSAARYGDLPRVISTIADALADRSGEPPEHPNVQAATFVVLGLVHTQLHAIMHHVGFVSTFAGLEAAVRADVASAAELVDSVLRQFAPAALPIE